MAKGLITKLTAAALLFAALLTSCGQSDKGASSAPSGYVEISDNRLSYDLYVPKDWKIDEQTKYTSAHKSATDASNVSIMAHELTSEESLKTLATYWKESCEPSLKTMFPDIKYTKEGKSYKLHGMKDTVCYEYTFTMNHGIDSDGKPNKVKYKVQQILTRKNATLYTLTYTATEKQFDVNAAEVAEIWGYTRFH